MDIIRLEGKELRRYQECVLGVAVDFANVCEKYNLQYSLCGGSVLGAIRHKGFIPWDDDIDMCLPRDSYNRLLKIFDEELGEDYFLQTPQNSPQLGLMVTQIRKKGTVARRKYDIDAIECGVSIDLYILDNVFENPFLLFIQKNMSLLCSFAISSIRRCKNRDIPQELIDMEGRKVNYSKGKLVFGRIFGIISIKKWMDWCDFWNSACKNENSKLVVSATGRKHFSRELYERSDMCVYRKAKFETEEFNIPISAEKFLKKFYGDYMKIPPVEEREQHLFLELKF